MPPPAEPDPARTPQGQPEQLGAVAYKGTVEARRTPTPRGEITRG